MTNTLGAQTISAANGIITNLSATTLNVSGLSTLFNVSIKGTISADYFYAPNATITTLSSTNANISGILTVTTLNVCGLATLSGVSITNTLTTQTLSAANATITTLSATTLNVSGLSTLFNVSVQTISASYFYAKNSSITTLSATNLYVSNSLTVSGTTVFPNLSGLVTFDGVPVLLNSVSPYICIGVSGGVGGTNVNAYGIGAALGNTGSDINAIGCNAAQNNSGGSLNAFGTGAGASNIGAGLIAIGTNTGASNIGLGAIAIGAGACTTNSGDNVIGIGSNALFQQRGSNVIGIGVNAGQYNTASGSIFIGSNAGSNARFSNALVLGNNPSGGYNISAANTFLVYSTVSSKPFLQGDMSAGFFGIGKTPSAALDVLGSGIFSANLTVSTGTTTLSLAIITTLSATNATIRTLSSTSITTSGATVEGTLSASNIYVSAPGGLGITIANNGTFTMNGTFSNGTGTTTLYTTTLGATTINSTLNGVTWPAAAGTNGQILQLQPGSAAAWTTPAAVSLAAWANNPAVANVNMSSFGLQNLTSINSVPIVFSETPKEVVGIGYGTLSGATGNEIFAVGRNAGIGAGGTNLIYLGSNPGGLSPSQDNFFTMYSTISGLPFLQGDLSAMWLGIGKLPTVALDVSGSATIRGSAFNVCAGLATLSNVQIVNTLNVCGQTNFSSNVSFTNISASNIFVYTNGTLNVSGSTSLTDLRATTISGSSLYLSNTLNVSGLVTVSGLTVQNTLSVLGFTGLGNLQASTISGSSLYSSGGLKVDSVTTLMGSTTVSNTLNVTGLTTLGNLTATTISGTNVHVSNSLNVSGLLTVSGLTVQRTLSVGGSTTLAGTTINGLLTVCGQTAFTNLSFAQLNGISWANPAADKTILTWRESGNVLEWDTINFLGLGDWAKSPAVSTISANQNGITGIVSFNNISAIFSASPFQIGLGPNALRANAQENIIALGISAGAIGGNTTGVGPNCIFLGSNPGGSSNFSNSFVIYSQTAGSPLIYGDLSKNQVTIAGQTNTSGYTLNVNGSAQATTLNVTGSSAFAGITVTSLTNSGVTTLSGNVNIPGTNTTLNVSGQANFSNASFISISSSNVFVYPSGTLNVSGSTSLAGLQATTISGSSLYLSNTLNVSGLATVSGLTVQNTLSVIGLTTLGNLQASTISGSSLYLSNALNVSGLVTVSGLTVQNTLSVLGLASLGNLQASTISGSSLYLSNTLNVSGLVTVSGLTVQRNLSVQGSTTLSGVTLNVLNNVKWPTTSGTGNQQLAMNPGGTEAIWATPGKIDSAYWACNAAVTNVNISGFDINNIVSFNTISAIISSTQIGIGPNVLRNNTAASVVAFGSNAGSNTTADSTFANCIYLGSNPGTSAAASNTFLVYSTTAGTPALQVNTGSNWLGVGKAPGVALDVVGSGKLSGTLTTTSAVNIGGITSSTNYQLNIVGATGSPGFVTFFNSVGGSPYVGMGYDTTISDGLSFRTNFNSTDLNRTALFISRNSTVPFVGVQTTSPQFPLDVSGQINTNTSITTPSLTVSTSTTLSGTLTLPTIGSTTYASKVLSYNSTTGAVTQSTLNLGTLGAADSNTMNANWVTTGGGIVTWNGSVVSGTSRILAIPLNKSMGSDGFFNITEGAWTIPMNGWSAAYFVPNSVPSTYPAANGLIKVFPYQPTSDQVGSNWIFICSTYADVSPMTLKWGPGFITIPSGGVFNSATGGTSWNVLGQATNIALGSNSTITGGTSIVIGSHSAVSAVPANNVIAIGTNAGSNLENLNNTIYIGSNAGYRPGSANTLVVHSTSSTAPTLQADLSNRWLGVGMVPSNALDVSGTIRASGPVISTLSVSGTSAASITLTPSTATTYFSLTSMATAFAITFPTTAPPTGTYWVLKNNSTVNYTITATNGVFNGGTTPSYFLQSGIGVTLAYSGTSAGAPTALPAYYTF